MKTEKTCIVCGQPLPAGHNAKRKTCSNACKERLYRSKKINQTSKELKK